MPPAMTAHVPLASDPSCAAVSMPRASPDAITKPAWPRSVASRRPSLRPNAEALRAPTMPTISRDSTAIWPRTEMRGGVDRVPQARVEIPVRLRRSRARRSHGAFRVRPARLHRTAGEAFAAAAFAQTRAARRVTPSPIRNARSIARRLLVRRSACVSGAATLDVRFAQRAPGRAHGAFFAPMRGSVPLRRRATFARCTMQTSTARTIVSSVFNVLDRKYI